MPRHKPVPFSAPLSDPELFRVRESVQRFRDSDAYASWPARSWNEMAQPLGLANLLGRDTAVLMVELPEGASVHVFEWLSNGPFPGGYYGNDGNEIAGICFSGTEAELVVAIDSDYEECKLLSSLTKAWAFILVTGEEVHIVRYDETYIKESRLVEVHLESVMDAGHARCSRYHQWARGDLEMEESPPECHEFPSAECRRFIC